MPGTTEKRFSRTQIPRSGSRRFSKEEMTLVEDAEAIQKAMEDFSDNDVEEKKLRESILKNALRRASTTESE